MSLPMIEPLPSLSDLFSDSLSAGHKIQKRFWFFNDRIAPSLKLPDIKIYTPIYLKTIPNYFHWRLKNL